MNNPKIIGVGIALAAVVIASAFAYTIVKATNVPGNLAERVKDALDHFGEVNITVTATNDVLEVKPIAELALSKVGVRSLVKYVNSTWHGDKMVIADQRFDVRFGWSLQDDVTVKMLPNTKMVHIKATRPRLLTLTRAEVVPNTIYSSEGPFTRLTPADQDEVTKQLEAAVYKDPEIQRGLTVAQEQFEKYFAGVYLAQGYNCEFEYGTAEVK
jgi:hypothetical protein